MSLPTKQKLTIEQGRTFRLPVYWESDVYAYVPVSAISQGAPCRVTTSEPHGLVNGWRAAVVSAKGMTEINALNSPPNDEDYRRVLVVTGTQIEFNDLNASDFTPYTSGGYVQFRVPMDLTGRTARMTIRDKVGGAELLTLTTENSRIVIDVANKVIRLFLTAAETAGITWRSGVYDLELISPSGDVDAVLVGTVVVVAEITV